jgi:hypothetical protein
MQITQLHLASTEVKNEQNYTFIPTHVFLAWCLIKCRYNFISNLQLQLLLSGVILYSLL